MNKFFKTVLSVLVTVTVILACVPAVLADNDFSGYNCIKTKEQLNNIRNGMNAKYYLGNDIVFTEADFEKGGAFYNGGKGWEPIGTNGSDAFTGILDGNGYSIKGLKITINSSDTVFAGLFGYNKGKIDDLRVEDATVQVSGGRYVYAGIICGASSSNVISGCYSTGDVSVTGCTISCVAGGMIGGLYGGTINDCLNAAKVTVSNSSTVDVGGICAVMSGNSKIYTSGNKGNLTAEGRGDVTGGGICGGGTGSFSQNVEIADSYNVGAISVKSLCDSYSGGIVGNNKGSVERVFNAGQIYGYANTYIYNGTIAGNTDNGTVADAYYIAENYTDGDTMKGVTAQQAKNESTFPNFNFDGVWGIIDDVPAIESLTDFVKADVEIVEPEEPAPEVDDKENIATDGEGDGGLSPNPSTPQQGTDDPVQSGNNEGITSNTASGNEAFDPFDPDNSSNYDSVDGNEGGKLTWVWVIAIIAVIIVIAAGIVVAVKKGFIPFKK